MAGQLLQAALVAGVLAVAAAQEPGPAANVWVTVPTTTNTPTGTSYHAAAAVPARYGRSALGADKLEHMRLFCLIPKEARKKKKRGGGGECNSN